MPHTTLISVAQLATTLSNPNVVIVDCRLDLNDVDWGRREYTAAHIPGAVYAHLDNDLSGKKTGRNGRHPLPEPDAQQRTLSNLGIGNDTEVVAYDEGAGMYASRLWWLLRGLGHSAVAVLDGGFAAWNAAGGATRSGEEHNPPRQFAGAPRADMTVDADTVASLAGRGDWRVVDARAPERYRGETEPLDRLPGHIPGARNHFFKNNLANGTFRSPSELRASFRDVLDDTPADHVVAYCGSGVSACHNLLALEHAGLLGAKLYPGSWSEWSSDPNRPVERDEPPAK